jgi:hypothetical protein
MLQDDWFNATTGYDIAKMYDAKIFDDKVLEGFNSTNFHYLMNRKNKTRLMADVASLPQHAQYNALFKLLEKHKVSARPLLTAKDPATGSEYGSEHHYNTYEVRPGH